MKSSDQIVKAVKNVLGVVSVVVIALVLTACSDTRKVLTRHVWELVYMESEDGTKYTDYKGYGRKITMSFSDNMAKSCCDDQLKWSAIYSITGGGKVIRLGRPVYSKMEIVQIDDSCLRVKQNFQENNQTITVYSFFQIENGVSAPSETGYVSNNESDTVVKGLVPQGVDLGLSVIWADRNLGSSLPEEYGDYYAWGETKPKEIYSWATYKWCKGNYDSLIKYNTDSYFGSVDNKTTLSADDDVAHIKLGGKWRMPTDEECTELRTQCAWTWTTQNGVNGYKVTSNKNGNSIFIPAAGISYDNPKDAGYSGSFWSSSLRTDNPYVAWSVPFTPHYIGGNAYSRESGLSVRPVFSE